MWFCCGQGDPQLRPHRPLKKMAKFLLRLISGVRSHCEHNPLTRDYCKFILCHLLLHKEWIESLSGLILWLSVKQLPKLPHLANARSENLIRERCPKSAILRTATLQLNCFPQLIAVPHLPSLPVTCEAVLDFVPTSYLLPRSRIHGREGEEKEIPKQLHGSGW